MSFGLTQKTINQLNSIFQKYPAIHQVKIYGSRARGDHRKSSDIDLAFFSESKEDLSSRLSWELDDLPTPYLFDIVNYGKLKNNPLKKEIDQHGEIFYIKQPQTDRVKKHIKSKSKQTEITPMPQHWNTASLGQIAPKILLYMGNGLVEKQNTISGDYCITRIETISNGYIDIKKTRFVSNIPQNILEKYLIRKGDILFSHINSEPHLGKTGIAHKNYKYLLHGMNLLLIRTNQKVMNSYFLNYVFNYYKEIGIFIKISGRAVNQSSINQGKMKALMIPVPPLEEQKKIAGILSQIQKAIEVQDKLIASTTELKKATMKHLFTYGIKQQKPKQTEIGPIPQHWKVHCIDDLFNLKQGKSLSSKNQTGLYLKPFLRTSNVFWGYLDLKQVDKMDIPEKDRKSLCLKKDDLLVCEGGDIGRTAIWNEELKECYYQNHIHRLRIKNKNTFPLFYMYWMYAGIRILNVYGTFGNRTTIPNLSGKRLLKFKIPVPPLEEQKKIAEVLGKIDEKIEAHQNKKSALTELFKTTLQKLMTAQIHTHPLNTQKGNLI